MVLLAALLAGCSSDASGVVTAPSLTATTTVATTVASTSPVPSVHATATTSEPGVTRLDCTDPIDELEAPPAGYEVVDDAVAMATSASSGPLQAESAGLDALPGWRFAKTGLIVRTGERIEIDVASAWTGRLLVWWGNNGQDALTERFVIGPCPGPAAWIVFPGGYWLAEPGCAALDVSHDGTERTVTVGLGADCP